MNTPRAAHILWADDEIDLLKPHILFLEAKGFRMTAVNSGRDALEALGQEVFDLVFLDEQMPGLGGIETLQEIKQRRPHLPVVMITKSEEEHIMEEAIGSKIADYLIKPVHPSQILLSVKRILEGKRLMSEQAMSAYQREFQSITMQLMGRMDMAQWFGLYERLIRWKLELAQQEDTGMQDVLESQFSDADRQFARFVQQHYGAWMQSPDAEAPTLSHRLLPERLPRTLEEAGDRPVYLVVIDNLRMDQWKIIEPLLLERFRVVREQPYLSILPTATHYARNALFAGLAPADIARLYPDLWVNEDHEGSRNAHEHTLFDRLLQRLGITGKHSYHKVAQQQAGRKLVEQFHTTRENRVTAIVYNFVDMLSHARSEMAVIKELADDDAAYRSLTLTWFEHSSLRELLDQMAQQKARVIITTDHGTIRVERPVSIQGERSTNPNPRYKVGRKLGYDPKDVFEVTDPEKMGLPRPQMSASYVFTRERDFFVYPNNHNAFVQMYRDTFQHGGISLEEMVVPWVELDAR
jgi:CheY-like chemotaxis protein